MLIYVMVAMPLSPIINVKEIKMTNTVIIRVLKVAMCFGLSLLLLGHYLISYAHLPERWGINGIIVCTACIAFGLILSLPTKIYLTILLMANEQENSNQK